MAAIELNKKLNEFPLPDNYIVYPDYFYVCDGEIVKSDIRGSVADLKRDLREHFKLEAKEICSCDVSGRLLS